MRNIVILGSGMAGFGAAHRLRAEGVSPIIYEKCNYYGGNTASFSFNGFVFDLGPHITYTEDRRIQDLLAESVGQKYETLQIALNNYWRGYWPKHPVQVNLYGLPPDVIVKVIADFVEERQKPERPIRNYADWLLASFGRTFAEQFPMQYTRKYHVTTAENMTTEWLGPRIYRPSLEEMLQGAFSPSSRYVHYVTKFRYPTSGGFASYLQKLITLGDLKLNHELVSLDPSTRHLRFSNGVSVHYDGLISSLPLPDLIRMIKGTPQNVRDAAGRLACSSCVLVNLGVGREDLSNAHMTYFYDEDICFTRLGFPHMLSPNNAPPGTGTIQAEVYFSDKYKPMSGAPEDWIAPVIRDLRRCSILRDDDDILFSRAMVIRYANVIFDLERRASLDAVHGYLDDLGIAYCGRYGDWGYLWTDESFKSGERAAEQVLISTESNRRCAPLSIASIGGVI